MEYLFNRYIYPSCVLLFVLFIFSPTFTVYLPILCTTICTFYFFTNIFIYCRLDSTQTSNLMIFQRVSAYKSLAYVQGTYFCRDIFVCQKRGLLYMVGLSLSGDRETYISREFAVIESATEKVTKIEGNYFFCSTAGWILF